MQTVAMSGRVCGDRDGGRRPPARPAARRLARRLQSARDRASDPALSRPIVGGQPRPPFLKKVDSAALHFPGHFPGHHHGRQVRCQLRLKLRRRAARAGCSHSIHSRGPAVGEDLHQGVVRLHVVHRLGHRRHDLVWAAARSVPQVWLASAKADPGETANVQGGGPRA